MSERNRARFSTQGWPCGTVLEPTADTFVDHLVDRGYAPRTIDSYLSCVAHFAHWSARERIGLDGIDEVVVGVFSTTICRSATALGCAGVHDPRSELLLHAYSKSFVTG